MTNIEQRHVEALEVLAGTRSHKDKRKSAVRHEDLSDLANFSYRLQSETVNAAPTAAQHNALVKDVHAIASMLKGLALKLEAKLK